MKKEKDKIVIFIKGGLVQWALSNKKLDIDLVIIDGDETEEEDLQDIKYVDGTVAPSFIRKEKMVVNAKFFKNNKKVLDDETI